MGFAIPSQPNEGPFGRVTTDGSESGAADEYGGRTPMRSPGRPTMNGREVQRQFWLRVAEGLSSEDAGPVVDVSTPVGARWFREGGGIPPSSDRTSADVEQTRDVIGALTCGNARSA